MQEIKLCLLGDSGVGKSSIVQRFVHDTFNSNAESTIGASFMTKIIIVDDMRFKFNIWDTAGQERYRALAPMYYRGAKACILVYDVTVASSFQSLKGWIRELQQHGPARVILAIAGNKCDLDDKREVTLKEARAYAENVGAVFIETSARTAVNVNELFVKIAKAMPQESDPALPNHMVKLTDNEPKKRKCCS